MVKIITDTTSVLSPAIAKRYNIPVIPQVIIFGEESFYEGINIDTPTFLKRLKSSKTLPKTAAPPPDLFIKEFEKIIPTGESILCIHPSSDISGTVRSAVVAANDFPNADIRVIDTRVVASPLATIVQLAAEWAEQGCDADIIEKRIKQVATNCRVYFLVPSLEFLARGGRIGGASALLGSMLQIKPILMLEDGKVNIFEKERTSKRALSRLKEVVLEQLPAKNASYLSILHADALLEAEAIADEFKSILSLPNIPIYNMPPAIITHGGPGILGIGFFIGEIPR